MESNDIVNLITTIGVPIISGIIAYLAAIAKAKKDIDHLREQNKHEIDKLMNQHKLDLESLERKHQMEVEKNEIEHRHKLELLEKEMEAKVETDFTKELMT